MGDSNKRTEIDKLMNELRPRLTNKENTGLLDAFKSMIGRCTKAESLLSLLKQDSKDRIDLDKVQQNKLLMKMIPDLK